MVSAQHLEALSAPQEAAVLEHVAAVGMQCPEAALAGLVGPPRDLDEAVVEGEVVSEAVLPTLRVLAVVGEALHDELVDVAQRQHLLGRVLDGHRGQRDVGVGRLLVAVRTLPRPRHRPWRLHRPLAHTGPQRRSAPRSRGLAVSTNPHSALPDPPPRPLPTPDPLAVSLPPSLSGLRSPRLAS